MQLNITVNPGYDSAEELNALSTFLLSLTTIEDRTPRGVRGFFGTGCAAGPAIGTSGDTAETPAPVEVADEPAEVEPVKPAAKKAAPKAKAAKAKEPEPEPEAEIVDEEEEGPDYGKLRLEIRSRFANWAEQVGMIEGKALLDSFSVGKFSELDNSQLTAFGKKLAVMEADL